MKALLMCEGSNELKIINMLLDANRLIFSRVDLLVDSIMKYHQLFGKYKKDCFDLSDLLNKD